MQEELEIIKYDFGDAGVLGTYQELSIRLLILIAQILIQIYKDK
jgi:hypothetical protein